MKELNKSLAYIRKRLEPYIDSVDEYIASDNQDSYYEIIKIPKKRGGYRYIRFCTNTKLRSAHKALYEVLRDYQVDIHPSAHGFVKGKSTFTNASNHVEQKYLLHVDLKDFFDRISTIQVKESLLKLDILEEVASFVATLTTVDGYMKQGLHTSPDLSNHSLYPVDEKLASYAEQHNLIYSRYGDDITISGSAAPDMDAIKTAIEESSFEINDDKIKLQKRGSNQYVTGLTVFDAVPRIPRKFKKRLRSQLYYIGKYGFVEHVKRTRGIYRADFDTDEEYEYMLGRALFGTAKYIVGHVSYVNSVEPNRAKPMWDILNRNVVRDYFNY